MRALFKTISTNSVLNQYCASASLRAEGPKVSKTVEAPISKKGSTVDLRDKRLVTGFSKFNSCDGRSVEDHALKPIRTIPHDFVLFFASHRRFSHHLRRNEGPDVLLKILAYITFGLHAVCLEAYFMLFKRPADGFCFGLMGHACHLCGQFLNLSIFDVQRHGGKYTCLLSSYLFFNSRHSA
jgi:hypothetical protein